MEYKNNLKYFKQSITPLITGIVIIAIGLILRLVLRSEGGWEIYQISNLIMVAGAVCAVLYIFIKPKDDELELQISNFIASDDETAKEKVMADDKRCKIIESINIADYIPDYEGSLFYKGSDGTVRTNWYSSSVIVLTTNKFYVYRKIFCVTEAKVIEEFIPFEYINTDGCKITDFTREYTFGKKTASREIATFEISSEGKTTSLIAHPDSFTDEFAARLNRRINSAKKASEE